MGLKISDRPVSTGVVINGTMHQRRIVHVLDAHLREDPCRLRPGYAAQALSAVRHMSLNLAQKLKTSTTTMCPEHAANAPLLLQRRCILKN